MRFAAIFLSIASVAVAFPMGIITDSGLVLRSPQSTDAGTSPTIGLTNGGSAAGASAGNSSAASSSECNLINCTSGAAGASDGSTSASSSSGLINIGSVGRRALATVTGYFA
ncbi:hypothetical protein LTS18_003029 [Coniosporium uncinatum]|uniref:Uncharacterized protein n=1 Tax=Coniosporium uncinatum TaxID=93489 RepID=A0ACC3D7Q8_9PEZI|nr:hypothetical protein LTS18_003029 [Coniosporium uncinatum]